MMSVGIGVGIRFASVRSDLGGHSEVCKILKEDGGAILTEKGGFLLKENCGDEPLK